MPLTRSASALRGISVTLGIALFLCALLAQAGPGRAAVATAHPLATQAAENILAQGGNAFDAAVAVSAALAVVEPYGSGIGGGGFFLLRQTGDTPAYHFLDARERAPLAAHADLYRKDGQVQRERSLVGALAAAIPGLPAALGELSERYGRLPLSVTLAPAIEAAEQGFPVDRVYRERARWRLEALRSDRHSAAIFLQEGEVPEEGFILRQPELAETLKLLAAQGALVFYEGPLARRLVEGVRAGGGVWSHEDLQQYRVVQRPALLFSLRQERRLITTPPPSAGGVALAQSLGILQQLPWQQADTVQRTHLVVETLRRAYRDRTLLGDPDHVQNPLPQLLAAPYLHDLAASIQLSRATPSAQLSASSQGWREGDHTTHFTILDAEGNAVAATLSINLPFGAAFTVPGTGILLNDEMDDFAADIAGANAYALTGSPANAIAAGKRPLSSMAPAFIESDTEFSSFGTPGGSRIPSMTLLSILACLDGKPVDEWPALPRFHHQFLPDVIEYEPGTFSDAQLRQLQALGHSLKPTGRRYGNQQVIHWNKRTGQLRAASDPRGIGTAYP